MAADKPNFLVTVIKKTPTYILQNGKVRCRILSSQPAKCFFDSNMKKLIQLVYLI